LRWSIRCQSEAQNGGNAHTLFISRFTAEKEEFLFSTERNCDVLWNKTSPSLAITDWSGSSCAEIYLVDLATSPMALPLPLENIATLVPRSELGGHCYYEAVAWKAPHRLLICVFGHTDENPSHGFAYSISVETTSGVATLRKKLNHEPTPEERQKISL